MRRTKSFFLLFLSLFQFFFFHSCTGTISKKSGEIIERGDIIEGIGTIIFLDLEGGFYGIITNGNHYVPIKLPQEFEIDGLRVKFKAKIRKDLVSIHMWGILIELININKIR
jgi:hypothetical protein